MNQTESWCSSGVITARSRETPGTYEGLTYTVVFNVPHAGEVEATEVVPASGQRRWNDATIDIVPCPIGMDVAVVCIGGQLQFFFYELPLTGEC